MCRQNEEVGRENLFNESYNSSNVIRITEQININVERLLYLAVQRQKYECFYFSEINKLQVFQVRSRKSAEWSTKQAVSRGRGNYL